jgi:hypothetical protein
MVRPFSVSIRPFGHGIGQENAVDGRMSFAVPFENLDQDAAGMVQPEFDGFPDCVAVEFCGADQIRTSGADAGAVWITVARKSEQYVGLRSGARRHRQEFISDPKVAGERAGFFLRRLFLFVIVGHS